MKNHKTIKKFISLILTAAYILAAASVFSVSAEEIALLSDSGYSALDLSLTKTVYNAIGQTGQVKAAVIQEMDVSMYATPYYSNTSSTDSEKYYAVKVDKDTHAYLVKSGTAKKTFTARPQRVMLAASQLVCTSDNTAVATVNSDGVITITGYGVANILVTYNGGTPADSSDDVSGAVTIFATKPDGNIITIDNTLQWTDENHSALEMRVNKITDASLSDIYEAGNKRFSASNLTSAFDPIGNDSSPLSIQVTGNSNLTTRNNYVSADTLAGGNASLIAQEYAANSRVMIQGWYYESGKGANDNTVYPKISFGYCGTTDISTSANDGRRAWQLGNKKGGYYRIRGGDANTYSANYHYFSKDANNGATTSSASATSNLSGFDTAIKATKGWHQFVMTVEPSMINPGTDYALTKVYLDGKLLTSQDIYIGDIEIGKRRFYIFLPKLGDATGYTADTAGSGNDYLHYRGLTIARFDNSQTVVDSIPADGAQNVPLYQTIRVKLGSPIGKEELQAITLNGKKPDSVTLDESKTVLAINSGKLLPDVTYTLAVAGKKISFKTTSDEGTANLIDDMKTHGYNVTEARSLDFADSTKSAEEYGIGFLRHCANLNVTVSDGIATFEEGKRSSQSDSGRNALILRNVTPYDSKADRVVISYKVKLNVPSSYVGDTEYAFASTTDHTGGIGVPVIAKKTTSRVYNPVTRSALPGANSTFSVEKSIPTLQTETGKISHVSLLSNNTGKGGNTAYNLAEGSLGNSRLSQTSFSAWRQIVYVVDMDTTGQNAPTWYFVDVDKASKNLNSKAAIYKLDAPATYGAGYTWVDSLYIPMSRAATTLSLPTSLSMKDVEIYSLSLDPYSQIENEISVADSASSEVIYADELSGKTADVTISGNIDAGSLVIFTAYDKSSGKMRLENVKSLSVAERKASVTMEDFVLPEGEDIQLCVFVWNSFADKKSYEMKYVYNLTE